MDNCWRENKNNAVLMWLVSQKHSRSATTPFCSSQVDMVARGLFPGGIFPSFLPKGHTHNEMDQHASRLSVGLRRRDVFTRNEMLGIVKASFRDLQPERVQQVRLGVWWLDYTAW